MIATKRHRKNKQDFFLNLFCEFCTFLRLSLSVSACPELELNYIHYGASFSESDKVRIKRSVPAFSPFATKFSRKN
jgi:hypothetical protein